MRLDESIEWGAGEGFSETVGHRLLDNLDRAIGILDAHFNHELIVKPADRTAVDPGREQPLVDISERGEVGQGRPGANSR